MSLPTVTGISGIMTGLENMRQDAERIAGVSAKGDENIDDLANAMVDLNIDQRQVEASVKVVQAVDEVLGSLLDVKV